jgi:hypothetical protein
VYIPFFLSFVFVLVCGLVSDLLDAGFRASRRIRLHVIWKQTEEKAGESKQERKKSLEAESPGTKSSFLRGVSGCEIPC